MRWDRFPGLLGRVTTPGDRWVMAGTACMILGLGVILYGHPGSRLELFRDNRLEMTLPLDEHRTVRIAGRLGPVTVEIVQGQARLREYQSPRMIGTRTGWIRNSGQVAACLPCGVLIKVTGEADASSRFDAIAE
ncbi:MAG: NusG domain II-containing protein [Magnetococcus sp. DMHC-1]|nr:NusG domain II-containing protein [Magnetococcales bacterium]